MNAQRANRNQAREAARQKAQQMRVASTARDKRNRILVQLGLALSAILVVGTLVAVVATSVKPDGPGPQNMLSDGIKVGAGGVAVQTPALQPGDEPVATPPNAEGVVDVTIFVDYLCPFCGGFERSNAETINNLLDEGAITLEVHPLAFLQAPSAGSGPDYSIRAANAAACVANFEPDLFLDYHTSLFINQPDEASEGLTDDQLIQLASAVGAGDDVANCITEGTFRSWTLKATSRAGDGVLAINNLDPGVTEVKSTPTILINGKLDTTIAPVDGYDYNPEDFLKAIWAATANQ